MKRERGCLLGLERRQLLIKCQDKRRHCCFSCCCCSLANANTRNADLSRQGLTSQPAAVATRRRDEPWTRDTTKKTNSGRSTRDSGSTHVLPMQTTTHTHTHTRTTKGLPRPVSIDSVESGKAVYALSWQQVYAFLFVSSPAASLVRVKSLRASSIKAKSTFHLCFPPPPPSWLEQPLQVANTRDCESRHLSSSDMQQDTLLLLILPLLLAVLSFCALQNAHFVYFN